MRSPFSRQAPDDAAKRQREDGFTPVERSAEHGFTPAERSPEHGFTLVELMVVIVIIGLLTTIVVINVLPSQDKARVEKAKADIALIEQGLEMYRLDNLNYPATGDGLQALVTQPASASQAGRYRAGGYLKRLPEDPWGAPYQYAFPGQHGTFDIYSYGADGRPGGEGDNADLGNWR
jgi:general secretion pathway protein G